MAVRRPSNFRVQFDDDPNALYRSDWDELKIEKLGQRMTLFFILFPCLIGIVLLVAYLDIKGRVTQTGSSGVSGYQKLSQDLESRFSSLSLKQAKLEEALSKKTAALEQADITAKAAIAKTGADLKTLASSVSDKKQLQQLRGDISKLEKSIAPVQDGLQTISSDIEILDKRVTQELTDIAAAIAKTQKGLAALKSDLNNLSKSTMGTKELGLTLKKEAVVYATRLNAATKKVALQIAVIEKQIQIMQNKITQLEKTPKTAPVPKALKPQKTVKPGTVSKKPPPGTKTPQPGAQKPIPGSPKPEPTPKDETVQKPVPELPTPKPGKIIEQELKE